jgi:O-antigen biosynthesis protein
MSSAAERFFILGCQRSGTTLMRLILESHPDIFCYDELKGYAVLQKSVPDHVPDSRLVGFKLPRWTEQLNEPVLFEEGPEGPCHHFYRGEKILFLYRDVRDTVASMFKLKAGESNWCELWVPRIIESKLAHDPSFRSRYAEELSLIESCDRRLVGLAALYWKYKTDALFRYLEQGLPITGVSYERLVANPRSTLQSVCAHLGIPFHENLLRHNEFPHGELFANGLATGNTDPTKPIGLDSVGQWNDFLSRDDAELIARISGDLPARLAALSPRSVFGEIADEIVRSLGPATVFDVGCARGFLVEAFFDRGVEARGVDTSSEAISRVRPDLRGHCVLGSASEPIPGGPYDLVTCIEVLEHVTESTARAAIEQMTRVTDAILFSSVPGDFTEPTHTNVHPIMYWLRLFREFQFYPDPRFDASFITSHAFLVRRRQSLDPEELLLSFNETVDNRLYRAAFLPRQERIEHLERDLASLTAKIGSDTRISEQLQSQLVYLQTELLAAQQRVAWMEEDRSRLEIANKSIEDSLSLLIAQAEQTATRLQELGSSNKELKGRLDSAKHEAAMWKAQSAQESTARRVGEARVESLQSEADKLREKSSRLQNELDEWTAHTRQLAESMELLARRYRDLRAELESVTSSPAWRFVLNYREWLQRNVWRHTWVRKGMDPLVLWLLAKASKGRARPVSLPAPVRMPAAPSSTATPVVVGAIAHHQPEREVDGRIGVRYEDWIREIEPSIDDLNIQRRMAACFAYRPTISVLVPVHKVPLDVLTELIRSVSAQTYDNWELCMTAVAAENPEGCAYLKKAAAEDARIRLRVLDENEGISGNSNRALALATGEFLALLDHDDTLALFALFEIVQDLNRDRSIRFFYSDKDQITADGSIRSSPLFKPEWSPEIMLNANYLTHLCVMRTEDVREVGGWRSETDGAQDWDLFLRLVRLHGGVRHIPKVLYHWRQLSTSVASGGLQSKPYAVAGQIRAVTDYCGSLNVEVSITHSENTGLHIQWPIDPEARVSIVFLSNAPFRDAMTSAIALKRQTRHPNFEILLPSAAADDASEDIRCVPVRSGATLIDRVHAAVAAATGNTIVFIDQCVTPAAPEWLQELTGPLLMPNVGITGARIVNAKTALLKHCGLLFGSDGSLQQVLTGKPEHVYEQFGGALWYRNWTAVSGACFAVRREAFDLVGGIDGELLYPRLDVHLCLKLSLNTTWRIVYNPYARLFQDGESMFETALGNETHEVTARIQRWFPHGDPHFNPNLECKDGKFIFRQRTEVDLQRGADYVAESRLLLSIFDADPKTIERSRRIQDSRSTGQFRSVTWFLPEFTHAFYGGVHTILRFADGFLRHGVHSNFCILGETSPAAVQREVSSAFPGLAQSSFYVINNHHRANELPSTDAAMCSLWTTAYAALEFDKTRRKLYFMQDDETLFYPASSTSALVEATYRFGFHGVCNTVSLLQRYRACGGTGEYFTPCVDRSVFFPDARTDKRETPYMVFCYGRPGHPRNCFELLSETMRMVKKRMGKKVLLVTAGADWDVRDYGLDGVVHNLGILPYAATGALYRACDAGVVLMMTRHPSYLPLELMACGALVITNKNADTTWLLQDNENCLLADLSASSIAERIEEGLRNTTLRHTLTANASDLINSSYSRWDDSIDHIYRYILELC